MALDHLPSASFLGPGDAVVFSDRALYQTYNFHDPECVELLAGWLARGEGDDGPGVTVVAGRPGSGRDYLVRAAAWEAGERGVRVQHARLSFDGFDPDHHTSLESFVDHQLRMRFAPHGGELPPPVFDRRGTLLGLAGSLPAAFLSAAGLSFLVAVGLSVIDLSALMASSAPALAGPRATPGDHLRALLDLATREHRLVLVLPADELPEPVVQWFVHEPRRNRRLSVVVATARAQDATQLYGEPLAHVMELRPMTLEALRKRVARRFAPHEFPDRFFSGVWKRTQGVSGQVALAMIDLEHRGFITRGDGRGSPWLLAVEPGDERLVGYFASHFYDQLNQIRDRQRPIDLYLVRFVELAALCGSIAPPRLIAGYMGLPDAERDDLLDRVDALEDARGPVFVSLDYHHPTFRNGQSAPELVYRFADESNRFIVLCRMIHKDREAHGLLSYLSGQIPILTRGTAELFASLAAYLNEGTPDRREYEQRLRWWTAPEEADALSDFLSAQVRSGKLDTSALWAGARNYVEWPTIRRLALLNAMAAAPDGLELSILPEFHAVRADLLAAIGRYAEALLDCRAGLRLVSRSDYFMQCWFHERAEFCSGWVPNHEDALAHARGAYEATLHLHGSNSTATGYAISRLASRLIEAGRPDEAQPYADEAIRIASLTNGHDESHERGSFMNALGVLLDLSGRYEEAVECHRVSLQLLDERPGPHREGRLMTLYTLGYSVDAAGRSDEAHSYLRAAVELAAELSTPAHPAYRGSLVKLLRIALEEGNKEDANQWAQSLCTLVEDESKDVVSHLVASASFLRAAALARDGSRAWPVAVRDLLTLLSDREQQIEDDPRVV